MSILSTGTRRALYISSAPLARAAEGPAANTSVTLANLAVLSEERVFIGQHLSVPLSHFVLIQGCQRTSEGDLRGVAARAAHFFGAV